MTILSYTGDADFGYSCLVFFFIKRSFHFESAYSSVKFVPRKYKEQNVTSAYLLIRQIRLLEENRAVDYRGFTEHFFWYIQSKNSGFENVVPGFLSNICHSILRQFGLLTCECWRIIEGLLNFSLQIPNF